MTSTPRVIASVAKVSFLEIISDKILYNIIVIATVLMGLGFLASRLTYVRPDRVVFGLGVLGVGVSLSSIAIFIGAAVLNREVERRTMYLALSRPISRFQFIAGKFVGLSWVLILNWVLVSAVFLTILVTSGGLETHSFTPTLFIGLVLLLFESFILAAVAIFFSSFSTTSLSAILAVGMYLLGNNVSQIQSISSKIKSAPGAFSLDAISFIIPNLENYALGTQITYGLPIPDKFVWFGIAYSCVVVVTLLVIASVLIETKEA